MTEPLLSGESLATGLYWQGVPFVAKHVYHFDTSRTQLLCFVMGVIYTVLAFAAGKIAKVMSVRVPARVQCALWIVLLAAATALPALVEGELMLWLSASLVTAVAGVYWPLIEDYLTAGRDADAIRHAVGVFNLWWMASVVVAVAGLGSLLERWGSLTFLGLALLTAPLAMLAMRLPSEPARLHESPDEGHALYPPSYPALLRAARMLLPTSYLLMAAMGPLLPFRLETTGVPLTWATPITALWMLARIGGSLTLRWTRGWHGHWTTLLFGALSMFLGVAGVLLSTQLWGISLGFVLFGVGAGMSYHLALYYALRVDGPHGEGGATHEGLIGLGYVVGPLLALACTQLGDERTLIVALAVIVSAGIAWILHLAVITRRRRTA